MFHYYLNMKSAFLGYKKTQVDSYIKEQLYNNFTTLSELSLRVVKLEGDKKQLELTSNRLKRELMNYIDENLPVNLFTEVYEALNKQIQAQPQRITIKKAVDDTTVAKSIDGAVGVIKQELGALSDKVESLSTMIEKLNVTQSSETESSNIETAITEDIRATAATLEEVTMDISPFINEKSKVESVDFSRDAVHNRKSDSTSHKAEKGKLLSFSPLSNAIRTQLADLPAKQVQTNSFFGMAVNQNIKSDILNLGINTQDLMEYADKSSDTARYNSFFDDISSPMNPNKNLKVSFKMNTELPDAQASKKHVTEQTFYTDTNTSTQNVTKSPEINEDAKYIRQKYIVGKIAGEDLYDRNGKLIISRRSPITPQVVDYADREGKLPELIVHMILRDME